MYLDLKLKLATFFGLIRNVILTHTDVDGVTCGAIAMRYLGDAHVAFAWPRNLVAKLGNIRGGPGQLVITDLSLNADLVNNAAKEMTRMNARGWKVIWIDHHSWSEGARKAVAPYCSSLIVEEAPSAARLVFQNLMPQDPVSETLAKLGDDADTATNSLPLTLTYKKAVVTGMRSRLLEAFAQGIFVDSTIEEVSKSLREDKQKIAEYVTKLTPQKTLKGHLFAVLDVRGQSFSGTHAGKVAAERYGLDFTVMVGSRDMISFFAGINREIDLLPVALRHRGGGHSYACGCTPNISWHSKLARRLFQGYTPPEVKTVLKDVVEIL
jgi:oligoribonuclease NrnB/cAMP/cGMP phosphodiesterase (DHH superfamily)